MILIVSDRFDAHADAVQAELASAGRPFARLNIDVQSLENTEISFSDGDWVLHQGRIEIRGSAVKVVWPRRLTVSLDLEQQTAPEPTALRLWRLEWNRCLYGFYNSLSNRFWMNGIRQASLADNKFYQTSVASEIGLCLPPTICTNSREKLIKFCQKNGPSAIKFMSQEIFSDQNGGYLGLYVNIVDEGKLAEFGGRSENPVTLQKYINKDYEVRYTFVDGEHLACKIESQKSTRAAVDWRRYDVANTPHNSLIPPRDVIEQVDRLMDKLDLTYGAIDFIVDPSGQWWFLEVNSAGQWLWIEDLAGLQISASIAASLSRRLGDHL